jgi:hypothetical protein
MRIPKIAFWLGCFALGCLVQLPAAYAEPTPLLSCDSTPVAAIGRDVTYQVLEENNQHTLVKLVRGVEVARVELALSQSILGYGGTWMFYGNSGRSGYFLVYFHKGDSAATDKVLIDVNLFQPPVRPLDSAGPQTDFICKLRS